MDFNQLIRALENRLKMPLPEEATRMKMAPLLRIPDNYLPDKNKARPCAIMLMLYPYKGSVYTAFMKRTEDGYAHSGQVSFPGGRKDPEDTDLYQTALRETEEEFGVAQSLIATIGRLSDAYIPVSNSMILPVIGVLKERPHFIPEKKEVAYIIEADLEDLLEESIIKMGKVATPKGFKIDSPYYDIQDHVVWGATAMMLCEFLQVVQESLQNVKVLS